MSLNTITTIDIGSSKIRTIIGKFEEESSSNLHVFGLGISHSNAIRKGNILDMEEFKNNLDKSLEEAEKMAGEQVSEVYLSFNSSNFEVVSGKWIIAISGDEITQEDVDRVLDMAKNGVDLPNREILKVIPEYFVVDLEEGVKNPVGMSARKLEVVATIFSMSSNVLNNIKKAVADVGIDVADIYPNLISAPEGVLSKRQKELGVVCVDIGASTTGLTVYEDGVLKYASVIPIGGDNVTNDIALGLRTSIDVAEKLKGEYSDVMIDEENFKDFDIELSKYAAGEDSLVSRVYLSKIIGARYEEILFFVRDHLRVIGKDGMLPEGAVFVWGGAKAAGLLDMSKDILKLPSVVGTPIDGDSLSESSISDPVFSGIVGTMILAKKYYSWGNFSLNISGIFGSIMKVIKKILP